MRESECVDNSTRVVSSVRSKLGYVMWVKISEKHQLDGQELLLRFISC